MKSSGQMYIWYMALLNNLLVISYAILQILQNST